MRCMKRFLYLPLFFCLFPLTTIAAPHSLGQSYLFISVYTDGIEGRLEITTADLSRVMDVPWGVDERLPLDSLEVYRAQIEAYVAQHLAIASEGRPLTVTFTNMDVRDIEVAEFVLLDFDLTGYTEPPRFLDVTYSVIFDQIPTHRNLFVIENNARTGVFDSEQPLLIFSPSTPEQQVDLASPSKWRAFLAFIWLGVWHIWIGIDHILFLIALILPSVLRREDKRWVPVPRFRAALYNIVAIITFFTIAHSITLALAALEVVTLPARLVESIIAGSIAIAALHNIYPIFTGRDWVIAFVFGLFHGFGFANVLGEIGLGGGALVLSLLGFNLGVELGQVAIIVVVFPVLFMLRRQSWYSTVLLRYGSMLLMAIALFWFVERAFNLPLSQYPNRYLRYAKRFLFR